MPVKKAGYHVYVDGSFLNDCVGYGAVVLKDGAVHAELSGYVADPSAADYRNIAGELQAVRETVTWCGENGVDAVHVYYDYNGIAAWATGRWKAKKDLTKAYAAFMRAAEVKITWHKVAGHSGDTWNDRADELARKGSESGTGKVARPQAALDGESDLTARARAFCAYLGDHDIDASFDKVYNNMYARILIKRNGERKGIFDLYNTKKKPWSPYLHTFKADSLKGKITELWDAFCAD